MSSVLKKAAITCTVIACVMFAIAIAFTLLAIWTPPLDSGYHDQLSNTAAFFWFLLLVPGAATVATWIAWSES